MTDAEAMTLTDFLPARIAEDERIAHDAYDPPDPRFDDPTEGPDTGWVTRGKLVDDCDLHPDTAAHIIRFSPARVLADCEANRQIIELHDAVPDDDAVAFCGECMLIWPCKTLRLLALPYADHPDYRQEWRE